MNKKEKTSFAGAIATIMILMTSICASGLFD